MYRTVTLADQEIVLGRLEFDFLVLITQYNGLPLTREELIMSVWSGKHPDHVATRLVDNLVYRINKKLGQAWFRALPGLGYALAPPNRTRTRVEPEYVGEEVVFPVIPAPVSQAHSY